MNQKIVEYDLYVDESGDFMETSTNPRERAQSKSKKARAPSQLGGLLVPRGDIDSQVKQMLRTAKTKAQLPLKEPIHAWKVSSGYPYEAMASVIINAVSRQSSWQPVRLVNQEKVSYGNRVSTYTNLVAELMFRIFEEKSRQAPGCRTAISVFAASWVYHNLDVPDDQVEHTLKAHEYEKKIREYLAFANVRRGLAKIQKDWLFQTLKIKSPRDVEALQVCDVLSNASLKNFNRLKRQVRLANRLEKLFGEYDFTLTTRELFERVDELVKEYSLGMAIIILAESLVHAPHATTQDQEFAGKLEERLNKIIERLGRMDFRGRDPQLALLAGWLDQLVGQQRLLDKGYEIAHWLLEHVEAPLRQRLASHKDTATIDWFAYSLRRWALTACNHKGILIPGQAEVEAMSALQPSVATQWEQIPLVMDGLIAQAVHYTDCFEFDQASERMRFVTESLKMQQSRFHDFMRADFPVKLRFDLRARALGTLVQSEIFAGATDPARLDLARKANGDAIAEFTSFSDRARQYQYRCQLETVARDYPMARKYLVKSLERTDADPNDYSHKRIADLVSDLRTDPEWKYEFTLLHWLRIGSSACLEAHEAGDRPLAAATASEPSAVADRFIHHRSSIEERDQFLGALHASQLLDSPACQGRLANYPAHSILRFVAVINASSGNWDDSLLALQRLHSLDPVGKSQFVLALILLAAQAEVAALMWNVKQTNARALLMGGDAALPAMSQMLREIERSNDSKLASINVLTQRWSGGLADATHNASSETLAPTTLLRLARSNAF